MGNYNLGRLIGKGSFGKVYLASHKLTTGSKVIPTLLSAINLHVDKDLMFRLAEINMS